MANEHTHIALLIGFVLATTASASDRTPVPEQMALIISEAAERYGVDERIVIAVARRESDFRRNLVSNTGARGVMQLMPETASDLGVRDCFNVRQNIFGGAKYLRQLQDMFDGDLDLMLAAYNAGPGAVLKYRGIPPYDETCAYVESIRRDLMESEAEFVVAR